MSANDSICRNVISVRPSGTSIRDYSRDTVYDRVNWLLKLSVGGNSRNAEQDSTSGKDSLFDIIPVRIIG